MLTATIAFPPFEKGGQGGFTPAMLPYARHLKPYARRLRSAMTDAEQRLWHRVRRRQIAGVQFYRQKPLGPYIVDFHAPAARLVVEIDGGQHFAADGLRADAERDAALTRMGLQVLRFDDRQVLRETDAVVEEIWRAIDGGRG
ncbi:endonuclease domain-containing protein [Luteimonas salinilitoris]|uniref:Endonuclease domain-containing protein n=1 Tax=Luteimonas salinilitoris TaxID=3237697 RepID=A0ABV4HXE7_9GAMM